MIFAFISCCKESKDHVECKTAINDVVYYFPSQNIFFNKCDSVWKRYRHKKQNENDPDIPFGLETVVWMDYTVFLDLILPFQTTFRSLNSRALINIVLKFTFSDVDVINFTNRVKKIS